jgi:ribosome-binding protein aMBF1 (putative translation factor)
MTVTERVMPEDAYYTALGDAIQAARWAKGWTQLQLASRIGVESGACISYWESCVRRPSAFMVDRLEALFGQRLRP